MEVEEQKTEKKPVEKMDTTPDTKPKKYREMRKLQKEAEKQDAALDQLRERTD